MQASSLFSVSSPHTTLIASFSMFSSLIFVGVLLSTTATAQQYKPLTVSTSAGVIEGAQCTGSQASSFLAIPFAEPPVGDLRLASPKPYDASYAGELLRANTKAPSCIQFGSEFVEKGTQSEDWWVQPRCTWLRDILC